MEQVMFGKVGLAALALVPVFGATHTGDLRELYNAMYPVNALTRDAFKLCHESDATFVRAVDADRERCLDHMPHDFALAIGRIRPDGDLLAWAPISEGEKAALRLSLLPAPPVRQRIDAPSPLAAFVDVRRGSASPAVRSVAAVGDLLAQPSASIDDATLARFILLPGGAVSEPQETPLPLLSAAPADAPKSAAAFGEPQAIAAGRADGA
jgi:hypothetical protein